MKKLLQLLLIPALTLGVGGATLLLPQVAQAQSPDKALCEGSGGRWSGGKCVSSGGRTVGSIIKSVSDILIFVIGVIAVIVIIIAGIRYAASQGDQAAVTAAKNAILYAIVGLVVAVAAYAIVGFVLARIQ